MPDIAEIIQLGTVNPWAYLPVAALLGALHALEPGHSKSLMAGFIIAIRGTPGQAMMLGLSAAIGHTIVVWGLALFGLLLGEKLIADKATPWLTLISGLMVMALALRLLWSIRRGGGHHGDTCGHDHHHEHHEASDDPHGHSHEQEIQSRFAGRTNVTTGEILWFGFTGGLLPCPAAIAVLLVCLQLREFTLGLGMVAAFSFGLAATLVLVGLAAAWGARQAVGRWSSLDAWSKRLPYASGVLVLVLGLIFTLNGALAILAK